MSHPNPFGQATPAQESDAPIHSGGDEGAFDGFDVQRTRSNTTAPAASSSSSGSNDVSITVEPAAAAEPAPPSPSMSSAPAPAAPSSTAAAVSHASLAPPPPANVASPNPFDADDEEEKLMAVSQRFNSAGSVRPVDGYLEEMAGELPTPSHGGHTRAAGGADERYAGGDGKGHKDDDNGDDDDNGAYVPPVHQEIPLQPANTWSAHKPSQNAVPSSYAQYNFASALHEDEAGGDDVNPFAPPSATERNNIGRSGSVAGLAGGRPVPAASATAMERSLLERGGIDEDEDDHIPGGDIAGDASPSDDVHAHGAAAAAAHGHGGDHVPGPMLLEYSKSASTIRKDFTTVDWFFSRSNMHKMRRIFRARNKTEGTKGKIKNLVLAAQGWIILCLVGLATAFSASLIHGISAWLSDLKGGYCSGHNIFVTRRVCCMDQQGEEGCDAWSSWSHGIAHHGSAGAITWEYIIYMLAATLFACGGSWVCVVYARQAAGSGIAELKIVLGGFVIKKFLGIRTLLFKTIGLTLAVASGMSLGKEGPMVHIACAWGNILSRPFFKYAKNEVKKSEVLSAACAAGVCAAFGSPLGGVLFSLEVVSSYFPPKTMWRSFWCAVCAALLLQWMDPFQTGKLVQFAVTIKNWQWFELLPFMILGAMGGIMGAIFVRLNVYFTKLRRGTRWIRSRPTLEVTLIAFVTALISFPNLFMHGNSGALLAQLFSSCDDIDVAADDDRNAGSDSVIRGLCDHDSDPGKNMTLILVACLLKFFLTTVTYGSAIPSGVFMPSLCSGALLGRAMGWAMLLWHKHQGDVGIFSVCQGRTHCITPALYAVIGASAVLGGITRMTLSLAVIMFEVTGGLETIVPIMIAVVFSKWFGDAFGKAGLYGRLIELNGLPHIDTHVELDLINPAAEMMVRDPVCLLTYGQTIASIRELLEVHGHHGFPIIDNAKDRLITGFIARTDLEVEMARVSPLDMQRSGEVTCHFSREPPPFHAPRFLDFSGAVDRHPIIVRPSMPADRIMSLFQNMGLRYVLCCSPRGRIMGIIKKKNLLYFLIKNKQERGI